MHVLYAHIHIVYAYTYTICIDAYNYAWHSLPYFCTACLSLQHRADGCCGDICICLMYVFSRCAAIQTRGLPRLLRCLGTHRTRRAIGSNNESHRMASIALGAMGVPGSAWPRASRTTRPRTAGEAQASHSFVQPRTASHSLAQLRTALHSFAQPGTGCSPWLSLAQPGTAWHSLAQPGTAWHSLAQLALAWHSLGESQGEGEVY